jgi:hypothetical protein
MKIMLDLDGTVHSFVDGVRAICARNAETLEQRLLSQYASPILWSFWKDFGFDSPTAIELINEHVVEAFSFPPTGSNMLFLQSANRIPGLKVVTAPWGEGEVLEKCKQAKTQWLRDAGYHGEIEFSTDKTGDWDLVIEDDPFHAQKAVEHGAKVIFVTWSYNEPATPVCLEAGLDENAITRVSWNELTIQTVRDVMNDQALGSRRIASGLSA